MKNRTCAVVPCVIAARLAVGVGLCATTMGFAAAALPTYSFASNSVDPSSSELPPVRDKLSFPDAKQIGGCEVYIDEAHQEYVIRPKNGANEGIISDSSIWTEDFKAMQMKLSGKDNPSKILKRDWPIRFDKRIYFYMHVKGDYNYSPLFKSIQPYTINMGDNVSIKFIKDMKNFFAQDYILDGLHHINGIEKWDTAHVISMENMFEGAHQLEGKLDLSEWNVSKNWFFKNMFSFVGNDNDSFVLNFSNKQFMNQAHVDYMFSSFHGVLIANNWTVEDSNAPKNPIRELMDGQNFLLTYKKDNEWIDKSAHLLITDNPIILEKNKTKQYKYYKKVKVIYKTKDKEQQVELELPAVYDSRIDDNGKLDASKPACSDPMKVVKPQIDEAIINAVKEMRTKNPALNLPENVIPVPVHEVKDTDSPTALFQTYYLATVKEEVTKAKTTYTADPNLEYKKVEYDTQPQDGKKQVITGAMKNGAWDPDAKTETEITKVVNGVARVGNQTTTVTVLEPGITYVADGNLAYNTTETQSEGVKGTSTSIDTYEVNSETGLTNTLDHHDMRIKKATNKVVKVGNKEVKTEDIQPGTVYEADGKLDYKQEQTTEGTKGTKTTTTIYKVNPDTGLTAEVDGTPKVETTAAKDKVIKVGNVEKKTSDIPFKKTYEGNETLTYQKQETKTPGQNGKEEVTLTYKVDAKNGLTSEVEAKKGSCTKPVNEVIQVGNKEVIQNSDGSTTTKTYKVNPDDGTLSDPTVVTTKPPVQNQKTVTFNKKDGSLLSTVKVETGKKVAAASMPAAPDEEGFTFKEWNTKQDGTGTTFNADTVVNNDLTVYAVYTKNPVTPAPQPPVPNPNPNPSEHGGSGSAGGFGYQAENELTAMYRLYNPYSHEHLFTTDANEKDNLVTLGWRFEGAVGKVYMHGEKGGVYRLYNPNTGEHHYTMKENEVAKCVKAGWRNEGVKFFSVLDEDKQTVGMVSMYNPYEKKFYHHYTSDPAEIAKMVKDGWRKEEIKWYAAK